VENAIKFTPKGGTVDVLVVLREESVVFEVKDTGIGIAPQDQVVIFEKFIQLENPLTRKYGGSGLGLSFASEILRAHGCRIEVESELGKGAAFRFRLPLMPEEALAGGTPLKTNSTENSQS
jgi:signal transduction histidine kinase